MWSAGSSLSDEEIVERVRRGIARYDRLRGWLIALYLGLAAAFIGLAVSVPEFLRKMALPGLGPGFVAGLGLGAMFGLLAVKIAHGLVGTVCGGSRTERLLIEYHDALHLHSGQDRAGP